MPKNYLEELHNLLAHHPGSKVLRIATRTAGEPPETEIAVNDSPPIYASARQGELDLTGMLSRYPAPVFINGAEINREPYTPAAGITRVRYEGNIQNAVRRYDKSLGDPLHNTILLDSVLYPLEDPSRPTMTAYYDVPDRRDRQPHWARSSSYFIQPNYRWDNAGGLFFMLQRRGPRAACLPSPEISQALLAQKTWQENLAADVIRRHADLSDLGPPAQREFGTLHNPKPETWRSCGVGEAGILPYGEIVTTLGCRSLSWAAEHCIARALYRNGDLCLVPVKPGVNPWEQNLPDISCDRVTVVTAQGEAVEYSDLLGAFRTAQNYNRVQHVTGARSITAHLAVSYPDGATRAVDLPMDILLDNEMDFETAFLTADWNTDRQAELETLLFEAYYNADREEDGDRYRKDARFLAGNLLSTPEEAFRAELQRLCDRFQSPWNTPGSGPVTVANDRQSFTYEPVAAKVA